MSDRIKKIIIDRLRELEHDYYLEESSLDPDQELLNQIANTYEKWESRLHEFFK